MRYEITKTNVKSFESWLQREERSQGTIEKYLRDLRAFCRFGAEQNATAEELKEKLASWKDYLIRSGYAVVTVNSMLTAVNGFFRFMGWEECRVRPVRRQRRIFSDEKKELSKSEYMCLLRAAEEEGNQRLYYILQTIAATGIRVSELPFITVESLKTGRSEVQCKGKLRVILLTRELCRALQGYCRKKGIQSGPVFITRSEYLVGNEAPVRGCGCGFGKSISSQSSSSVCANLLPDGKGYREAGRSAGSCEHRHHPHLYYGKRQRTRTAGRADGACAMTRRSQNTVYELK